MNALQSSSFSDEVRQRAAFNYKKGVAGVVLSVALTVAAVCAIIFSTYALAYGGTGTFALYHSVKVLVIGAVAAGLGAILTVRMAKKASQARKELRESDNSSLMASAAKREVNLLKTQLEDANDLLKVASGSLGEFPSNSVGSALLDDLEKSLGRSKERGLLGVVLVIVGLVMFTMVVSSLAAGVTTGNAMVGVWLLSSIAGVAVGAALLISGVNHFLGWRSRSSIANDLSNYEGLETSLRALEKHPEQLQAKINKIEIRANPHFSPAL